jgi:hypothetical protein
MFQCPNGHKMSLAHKVDDGKQDPAQKGLVTPSIGCPMEGRGCDFHGSGVILEGWGEP